MKKTPLLLIVSLSINALCLVIPLCMLWTYNAVIFTSQHHVLLYLISIAIAGLIILAFLETARSKIKKLGGFSHLFLDTIWAPIYLLTIYILHPILGTIATIGALSILGLLTLNEIKTKDLEISVTISAISKYVRFTTQVIILGVGGYLITRNQLTPGGIMTTSILFYLTFNPIEDFVQSFRTEKTRE
ncbi:MAG: hypothetical protein JSS53_01645 [Proteobacteria bacterium]|nr:hypothetical protein [Pseudomonadota bacterium]